MLSAAVKIELKVDEKKLAEIREKLAGIPRGVPKALATAINKVAAHGRTRGIAIIRQDSPIQRNRLLGAIHIKKAGVNNLSASVGFAGRPIPMGYFPSKQTKQGTLVTFSKSRGPELIEHAFKATMPSGHKGVFVRAPNAVHRKVLAKPTKGLAGRLQNTFGGGERFIWSALPIKERKGPNAGGLLSADPKSVPALANELNLKLDAVIDSQVKWLLDKGQPKPESAY